MNLITLRKDIECFRLAFTHVVCALRAIYYTHVLLLQWLIWTDLGAFSSGDGGAEERGTPSHLADTLARLFSCAAATRNNV